MSRQRILLVGGLNEMFLYRTAVCVADGGFEVYVASPQRRSSLRLSRHVSGWTHVPLDELTGPVDVATVALSKAVAAHRVDAVFATDIVGLRACNRAAEFLRVPVVAMPSLEVIDVCSDKWRFSALLDRIGCRAPATDLVTDLDQVDSLSFDTPKIVKPVDGDGGIGVARVDSASDLAAHLRSGDLGTDLPVLVQEFIPGHDIDCSFYAEDGVITAHAVQRRVTASDPTIEFVEHEDVVDACGQVLAEIGYSGLGHADLRIDERDGSVVMIEINPRVWGSVHYAWAAGANFPAYAAHRALGSSGDRFGAPLGRCTNPPLRASVAVRGFLGLPTVAPSGLNPAETRMYVSKHRDPVPMIIQRVRSRVWRSRERKRMSAGSRLRAASGARSVVHSADRQDVSTS